MHLVKDTRVHTKALRGELKKAQKHIKLKEKEKEELKSHLSVAENSLGEAAEQKRVALQLAAEEKERHLMSSEDALVSATKARQDWETRISNIRKESKKMMDEVKEELRDSFIEFTVASRRKK